MLVFGLESWLFIPQVRTSPETIGAGYHREIEAGSNQQEVGSLYILVDVAWRLGRILGTDLEGWMACGNKSMEKSPDMIDSTWAS